MVSNYTTIPILAYHKIEPRFEFGVTTVFPHQFEKQMRFLSVRGYKSITLSELVDDKHGEKNVVLTFDDAYENMIVNGLPIMEEWDFKATIFIVSGFVGKENLWDVNLGFRRFRHMGWKNLRYLVESGFEIGSHSHTHPDLTKISDRKVKEELSRSRKTLEDKLGVPVRFISYPFGRYSARVKEMAQECGYTGGVCLSHPFKKRNDIFEMERQALYIFDTMYNFEAKLKLMGNPPYIFEKIKGRIVNFFAGATFEINRVKKFLGKKSETNSAPAGKE